MPRVTLYGRFDGDSRRGQRNEIARFRRAQHRDPSVLTESSSARERYGTRCGASHRTSSILSPIGGPFFSRMWEIGSPIAARRGAVSCVQSTSPGAGGARVVVVLLVF